MHPPKNSDNIHIVEVAIWAIKPILLKLAVLFMNLQQGYEIHNSG